MFFFSRERKRKTFFAAGPLYFGPWIVSQPPAETQKRGFTGFVNYLTTLPSREKKKKKTFAYHYYCTTCCCCFLSFFCCCRRYTLQSVRLTRGGKNWRRFGTGEEKQKKKKTKYLFFFSLLSLCVVQKFVLSFFLCWVYWRRMGSGVVCAFSFLFIFFLL